MVETYQPRDDAKARKALAHLMSAGQQMAAAQRPLAAGMAAIAKAKADGYATNTGYDTARSGPNIAEDGSVNGSTPATMTANEWLTELEDDIIAQCKAFDVGMRLLMVLISRVPGGKDPKAFDRMRCSGGEGPWARPECERMAVTKNGLCDACRQRKAQHDADPEGYTPRERRRIA